MMIRHVPVPVLLSNILIRIHSCPDILLLIKGYRQMIGISTGLRQMPLMKLYLLKYNVLLGYK